MIIKEHLIYQALDIVVKRRIIISILWCLFLMMLKILLFFTYLQYQKTIKELLILIHSIITQGRKCFNQLTVNFGLKTIGVNRRLQDGSIQCWVYFAWCMSYIIKDDVN